MTKLEIQALNFNMVPSIQNYTEKRLEKILRLYANNISSIRVNLSHETRSDANMVEIIVLLVGGKVLRNHTRSEDMYASIDVSSSNIDKQLNKQKKKLYSVKRQRGFDAAFDTATEEAYALIA